MSEGSQGGQVQEKEASRKVWPSGWGGWGEPDRSKPVGTSGRTLNPCQICCTLIFFTSIKPSKQDPKATIEKYRPEPSHHLSSPTPAHPRRHYPSSRIKPQSLSIYASMKPPTLIKKLLIGSGHVTKYSRYLSLDRSINLITDIKRPRYYSLSRCASTQAALHSYHQLLSPHHGAQSHCSLKLWNPLSASLSKADEIEKTMMKHSSLEFDQKTLPEDSAKKMPPAQTSLIKPPTHQFPHPQFFPKPQNPSNRCQNPIPNTSPQNPLYSSPIILTTTLTYNPCRIGPTFPATSLARVSPYPSYQSSSKFAAPVRATLKTLQKAAQRQLYNLIFPIPLLPPPN